MKLFTFAGFLHELRSMGPVDNLEGMYVLSVRGNVYVLDKKNFKRYRAQLKRDLVMVEPEEHVFRDLNNLRWYLEESRPDILAGTVVNGYLELEHLEKRHSLLSPDVRKLVQHLGLKGLRVGSDIETSDYYEEEDEGENTYGYAEDVDPTVRETLKTATFYHGTCLSRIPRILSIGLQPVRTGLKRSNYDDIGIQHTDKVFITRNYSKAYYHAVEAGRRTGSPGVILTMKVPDVAKLIPDYDASNELLGFDHPDTVKYDYQFYNNETGAYDDLRHNDPKGKFAKYKIGNFGYLGAIYPAHFTGAVVDEAGVESYLEAPRRSAYYAEELADWKQFDISTLKALAQRIKKAGK